MIPNRSIGFIALGLLLSLSNCSKPVPEEIKILRWVERADPVQDAQVALSRGNHSLKAVRGESTYIPGISDANQVEFRESYGISVIEGTSDNLSGPEHARLNDLAMKYAKFYNQHIVTHFNPGGSR